MALSNLIAGCGNLFSKVSIISPEKAVKIENRKTNKGDVPKIKPGNIEEIKLRGGIVAVSFGIENIIYFDSLGGKINLETGYIYGNDINGIPQELNSKKAKFISYNKESYIRFDDKRGRLNPDSLIITGTSIDGQPIEIPIDEVQYLRIRRFFSLGEIALVVAFVPIVVIAAEEITGWHLFD